MDFRCLWFTSANEFIIWKQILNEFPFPLLHKQYQNLNLANMQGQCEQTAVCIWSEKEYPLTPKPYRDYMSSHSKPSLLLLKNAAFALKAFERGFNNCLLQEELKSRFKIELIKLLALYYKPSNKPIILKRKLYIPVDPKENEIHFIEFKELIQFYRDKEWNIIDTVKGQFKTKIPFLWLHIQFDLPELQICELGNEHLINPTFIENFGRNNHNYYCLLTTQKKLILTPLQHHLLKNYFENLE